jgi:hypothetical protein
LYDGQLLRTIDGATGANVRPEDLTGSKKNAERVAETRRDGREEKGETRKEEKTREEKRREEKRAGDHRRVENRSAENGWSTAGGRQPLPPESPQHRCQLTSIAAAFARDRKKLASAAAKKEDTEEEEEEEEEEAAAALFGPTAISMAEKRDSLNPGVLAHVTSRTGVDDDWRCGCDPRGFTIVSLESL